MRPAGKTINAFAALREESAILKQKEKKERALERKARKEAGSKIVHHAVPSSIPSSTVMTLQHGYSWADISDDDDEENLAENKCSQEGDNLEAYLSSSEEEASDEDVEGNDPVDGRSNTNEQSDSGSTGRMSDKQQNLYANGIQQSGRTLTKKEKKKQEMEDLDALLNDLGLSLVENEYQNQSISEATTSSSSTGINSNPPKNKKKKRKTEKSFVDEGMAISVIENQENTIEPQLTISHDEALNLLKKAAAAKKKKSGLGLPAAVLAEAKKKSEAKKAKQKKEKFIKPYCG